MNLLKKSKAILLYLLFFMHIAEADTLSWSGSEFELKNVKAEVITINGEEMVKVERDLDALPFDIKKLSSTVDEPTYLKLANFAFTDGIFEVKVMAKVQQPAPFPGSQGFIGLHFRASADDGAFESVYLRPNAGRAYNQFARNHAVQYFAYPDFKFDHLRKEFPGVYETYADIGLNEWITMRLHVHGDSAELYLNDGKYPAFIVEDLKGSTVSGGIGFFVDIGTEGYFKDFKIISSADPRARGGAQPYNHV